MGPHTRHVARVATFDFVARHVWAARDSMRALDVFGRGLLASQPYAEFM